MVFPTTRMRRLRKNAKIRNIVRETKLERDDLIYPRMRLLLLTIPQPELFKRQSEGSKRKPIWLSSLTYVYVNTLHTGTAE